MIAILHLAFSHGRAEKLASQLRARQVVEDQAVLGNAWRPKFVGTAPDGKVQHVVLE